MNEEASNEQCDDQQNQLDDEPKWILHCAKISREKSSNVMIMLFTDVYTSYAHISVSEVIILRKSIWLSLTGIETNRT